MSKKREKDWVKITTPENKDMIASPEYVKRLLGLGLPYLRVRLNTLEFKIKKLESPLRQETIVRVLRIYGKHNRIWLSNRVSYEWYDLDELIKKGIVIKTKSGTQTMYELAEVKKT